MTDVLLVRVREEVGSNAVKRVRRAGEIPAVLYGHHQPSVHLAVPADQVNAAIRHGSRMVELQGGVRDTALIRDVQWDPFGIDVLHLDLARVSASEAVQVSVPVELRGEAPGVKQGGIVEHQMHEVEIECAAASLPEKLVVNINSLQLDESIRAGELKLPEGVSLLSDPEGVVVHCAPTVPMAEEEEVAEVAEPEVIGRREQEEEAE